MKSCEPRAGGDRLVGGEPRRSSRRSSPPRAGDRLRERRLRSREGLRRLRGGSRDRLLLTARRLLRLKLRRGLRRRCLSRLLLRLRTGLRLLLLLRLRTGLRLLLLLRTASLLRLRLPLRAAATAPGGERERERSSGAPLPAAASLITGELSPLRSDIPQRRRR